MRDLWIGIFLLLVIAGSAWWWLDQTSVESPNLTPVPAADPEPETAQAPQPSYPVPLRAPSAGGELVDLPDLSDSDSWFALEVRQLLGDATAALLVDSGVVERFVTTVDNLPADAMNERIRPFRAVPGSLLTEEDLLSAENFARYDPYVGRFLAADPDTLISSYARFYPLFQQAYEELGYPNRYFNDRLVEVIDHLLETPQPDYPLELARPHVLYEYADADLQALSVGQKALLRMGPEHAQAVKQHLRELRNRLVSL